MGLSKNSLPLLFGLWILFVFVVSVGAHTYAKSANVDNDYVARKTFVDQFSKGGQIFDWLCQKGIVSKSLPGRARLSPLSDKARKAVEKKYPNDAKRIFSLLEKFKYTVVPQIVFLALAWPVFLYFLNHRFRASLAKMFSCRVFMSFLCVFSLSSIFSSFYSQVPLISVGYFVALLLVFVLSFSFSASMSNEEMGQGLVSYSFLGAGSVLCYACYYGSGMFAFAPAHRLGGLLQANELGFICVSIILASLLNQRTWMRFIVFLPVFWVLLLTNSRASLIGVMIGLCVWLGSFKIPKVILLKAVVLLLALAIFLIFMFYYHEDMYKIGLDFFRLSGGETAAKPILTGRGSIWLKTWALFMENPWAGLGWRMSEHRLGIQPHNSFLRVLADTGIVGAGVLFGFFFLSLYYYLKSFKGVFIFWAVGVILAGFFVGMFEDYFFSVGNPTAVIILVVLVRGFVNHHKEMDKNLVV